MFTSSNAVNVAEEVVFWPLAKPSARAENRHYTLLVYAGKHDERANGCRSGAEKALLEKEARQRENARCPAPKAPQAALFLMEEEEEAFGLPAPKPYPSQPFIYPDDGNFDRH